MDNSGCYEFKVRSYECGASGLARLGTICNYLQEAASMNAAELSFSKSDFAAAGSTASWVLSKLKIRMERYPAWDETVKILTFPRGGRKIVAWRDFKILDENSSVIGIATSEWMMVDLATRKLLPVLQSVIDAANTVHEPVFGEENFEKVRFPAVVAGDVKRATFTALNGHIDLNGHVNNVHYVEWMLEPLYCALDKVYPRDIDIVFRSETFAGDRVEVEVLCEAETGCVYHRVFSGSADRVVALTKGTCV